jgi:multimeric flavodoxin WrbA
MKILLLNSSPRINGNTKTALSEIIQGIQSKNKDVEAELLDITQLKLSGCINCNNCKENGGICIIPDDSNMVVQKIYDSDVIILGTPVYYWGMNAQLKMVIDKLYCKDDQLRQQKKKLGVVAVGEANVDDPQYQLIFSQIEYICNYMGWNFIFSKAVSAFEEGDLARNTSQLQGLYDL